MGKSISGRKLKTGEALKGMIHRLTLKAATRLSRTAPSWRNASPHRTLRIELSSKKSNRNFSERRSRDRRNELFSLAFRVIEARRGRETINRGPPFFKYSESACPSYTGGRRSNQQTRPNQRWASRLCSSACRQSSCHASILLESRHRTRGFSE